MGNYLEIDGRETNNKYLSHVLINNIRLLDSRLKESDLFTNKQKRYFMAERYEKGVGYGNWTIKRKGMALLVCHLRDICDDEELLRRYVERDDGENFNNATFDTKLDHHLYNYRWCYDYVTAILADMVLDGKKSVEAEWV